MATGETTYSAFISYSHHDKTWAEWLQKRIESYSIPSSLRGTSTRHGVVPNRLARVFRDRDELATSPDLSREILAAMEASSSLVVICSPYATYSRWVNEEIKAFKALGREDRIFALIVDGKPHASEDGQLHLECFPDALRRSYGPDGTPGAPTEPIAADVRAGGDGPALAVDKIVAGLLGVGVDALVQRQRQLQRRRSARRAMALTALAGILALGAGGYWYWNRETVQYFANIGSRYGAPFGIDPVASDAVQHRLVTFAVKTKRGITTEVDILNGHGALAKTEAVRNYDLTGLDPDVARTIVQVDSDTGKVLQLKDYDSDGKLVQLEQFSWSGDNRATVKFVTPAGDAKAVFAGQNDPQSADLLSDTGYSTVSGHRLVFGSTGLVERRTFVNASGYEVADSENRTALTYRYDSDGRVAEMAEVRPAGDDGSAAENVTTRFTYQAGRMVTVNFLDGKAQPFIPSGKTFSTRAITYDRWGNPLTFRYYGMSGIPAENSGAAVIDSAYDTAGDLTELRFLDATGRPVNIEPGYARIIYKYDQSGLLTEKRLIDATNATLNFEGYGYDSGKQLSEIRYYSPVNGQLSYAARFTRSGSQITSEKTVDAQGNCFSNAQTYCEIRRQYDDLGRCIRISFFGSNGELVTMGNAAILSADYDSHDQLVRISYYDVLQHPLLPRKNIDYDEHGNVVRVWFSDLQGRLMSGPGDIQSLVKAYDGAGHVTSISFSGTDMSTSAVSRIVFTYDAAGRRVQTERFNAKGAKLSVE